MIFEKCKSKKRGSVLIEMMLVLAIFSTVLMILYSSTFSTLKGLEILEKEKELREQAMTCASIIEREIKNSIAITEVEYTSTPDKEGYRSARRIEVKRLIDHEYKNTTIRRDIFLNKGTSKVFIRNVSSASGFEAARHIEDIKIKFKNPGKIDIIICGGVNNYKYYKRLTVTNELIENF